MKHWTASYLGHSREWSVMASTNLLAEMKGRAEMQPISEM